jgi:hypothetical protein
MTGEDESEAGERSGNNDVKFLCAVSTEFKGDDEDCREVGGGALSAL